MFEEAFPGEDPINVKTPESITGHFVNLADAACQTNGQCIDL
jgi:hypothetical protein